MFMLQGGRVVYLGCREEGVRCLGCGVKELDV